MVEQQDVGKRIDEMNYWFLKHDKCLKTYPRCNTKLAREYNKNGQDIKSSLIEEGVALTCSDTGYFKET